MIGLIALDVVGSDVTCCHAVVTLANVSGLKIHSRTNTTPRPPNAAPLGIG
jgi:hypothetical protein